MKSILIVLLTFCLCLAGCGKKEQAKTPTIDPSKHERFLWAFETGDAVNSSPAIGSDGTVFSSDKKVFTLNPDGTKKWAFGREHGPRSPAIGLDGTVYIGYFHGMFYAIDGNTGAKKWEFEGNAYPGACTIGVDDTVYIPFADERNPMHWTVRLGQKMGVQMEERRFRHDCQCTCYWR